MTKPIPVASGREAARALGVTHARFNRAIRSGKRDTGPRRGCSLVPGILVSVAADKLQECVELAAFFADFIEIDDLQAVTMSIL
jgi:hypothetical protein